MTPPMRAVAKAALNAVADTLVELPSFRISPAEYAKLVRAKADSIEAGEMDVWVTAIRSMLRSAIIE